MSPFFDSRCIYKKNKKNIQVCTSSHYANNRVQKVHNVYSNVDEMLMSCIKWVNYYIQLYSPKMVAIKNLTNLTKMLRNSPQFTTIIQYAEHHHTHSSLQ